MMPASSPSPRSLGERLKASIRKGRLKATTVKLKRNSNVYTSGEMDRNLYLVEEGQVKVLTHTSYGKDCLVAIYAGGDLFGEKCLFRERREETVIAMRPTVLTAISCETFLECLASAGVLEDLVLYLLVRLAEREEVITELVTADSEQRLASTLLQLARKLGKGTPRRLRIEHRISQEDLSRIVGTTRSRVGFFLKRFDELGLIERPRDCFLILDEQLMSDYLEGCP
jgi:CRP-like cAMP-binding protein